MLRSNRGAARVSVIWIISVGVVALAAIAFAFISQSDLAREKGLVAAANEQRQEKEDQFQQVDEVRRELSKTLGWYDRSSADPTTDLEAAKAALAELRTTFPDISATDTDFQTVLPTIKASYDKVVERVATLEGDVARLQNEVSAAQAAAAQVASDKDAVIARLRQQAADEKQNAEQRQQDLEGRLADLQSAVADADAKLREANSEFEAARAAWQKQRDLQDGLIASRNARLRFQTPEFANRADGRVLTVSNTLPLAYIDIGANQRLVPGTSFEIRGGPPGAKRYKGRGVVTQVFADRAQMSLVEQDRTNPVAVGDEIVNPLFDSEGKRVAVLAGSFAGDDSRENLKAQLARIGIEVRPKLELATDFLIVGGPLYTDPETKERLEEPLQPEDLPIYKDAVARHVQVVPLADVKLFLAPAL